MSGQRLILIQGDARRIPLGDKSVQCVVTSPPYWSLRDYGIPPSVWGGDETCEHEWGRSLPGISRDTQHVDQSPGARGGGLKASSSNHSSASAGQFCQQCGAWFGCLGLEPTPELFVEHQVQIFREVRRVLRDDGTLWLNIGDSYNANQKGSDGNKSTLEGQAVNAKRIQNTEQFRNKPLLRRHGTDCDPKRGPSANGQPMKQCSPNLKPKDLVGIPWLLAFALRADGWYLRQEIIWAKPNPMPESVTDRCTKAHESLFLLTKSPSYFCDMDAIREPVTSTGGASFGPQTKTSLEIAPSDGGHIKHNGIEVQSRKLDSPQERNHPLGRNKRSVWFIATQSFPEAHFATYPIKLVNPCIQAGTSEKGCCRECGAPWNRVVDRVLEPTDCAARKFIVDGRDAIADANDQGSNRQKDGHKPGWAYRTVKTTWLPSCKCNAGDPVPCIVLDPFSGAATTGVAAKLLGRSYVGIEPKAEYIEISRRRLEHAKPGKTKRMKPREAKPEPSLF